MVARIDKLNKHRTISKNKLRLWIRLLRSTRYMESVLRIRLRKKFSVTLSQFDVLAALSRSEDGMIMSEVSQLLMVSNGNITGIVDRLTEEGLVIRSMRGGDRRTNFLRLTRKGQRKFHRMAQAHERWIEDLLQDFSSAEVNHLIALLSRLKKPETNV